VLRAGLPSPRAFDPMATWGSKPRIRSTSPSRRAAISCPCRTLRLLLHTALLLVSLTYKSGDGGQEVPADGCLGAWVVTSWARVT
jgi:hypothetical protein